MSEAQKTAVIIGAGPAGLTAAYELLTKTDIRPIILRRRTLSAAYRAPCAITATVWTSAAIAFSQKTMR